MPAFARVFHLRPQDLDSMTFREIAEFTAQLDRIEAEIREARRG